MGILYSLDSRISRLLDMEQFVGLELAEESGEILLQFTERKADSQND
jgi:hypothetical protein